MSGRKWLTSRGTAPGPTRLFFNLNKKNSGNLCAAKRATTFFYLIFGHSKSETADYRLAAIRAKSIFTGTTGQVAGIDKLKPGVQTDLTGAVDCFRRSRGQGIHPITGKET